MCRERKAQLCRFPLPPVCTMLVGWLWTKSFHLNLRRLQGRWETVYPSPPVAQEAAVSDTDLISIPWLSGLGNAFGAFKIALRHKVSKIWVPGEQQSIEQEDILLQMEIISIAREEGGLFWAIALDCSVICMVQMGGQSLILGESSSQIVEQETQSERARKHKDQSWKWFTFHQELVEKGQGKKMHRLC